MAPQSLIPDLFLLKGLDSDRVAGYLLVIMAKRSTKMGRPVKVWDITLQLIDQIRTAEAKAQEGVTPSRQEVMHILACRRAQRLSRAAKCPKGSRSPQGRRQSA